MQQKYNKEPLHVLKGRNHDIAIFQTQGESNNIDQKVVDGFGEEWGKFYEYTEEEIKTGGDEFFDILTDKMVSKNSYIIDIGCGNGRWSRYLSSKVGFIEALDPSDAIFVADKLLDNIKNVRLSKASTETIPFDDNVFDFGMSVGVLHHIPNTQKALNDCVKKIKPGGYFYTYLYYKINNRGFLFKSAFYIASFFRYFVSRLNPLFKKPVCDIIAVIVYLPPIFLGRMLRKLHFSALATKLPLSWYQNKTFFIIRNDALDRFGTKLEHRFSKQEVKEMMEKSGLKNIVIAETLPYWHAVGQKG